MVSLRVYEPADQSIMVPRVVDFYRFHSGLVGEASPVRSEDLEDAKNTIESWRTGSNELYCIQSDKQMVGFLHIGYRGEIAAWIEDLYVDSGSRGQGIATQAIQQAEQIIRSRPGYQAVCFDVAPRNEAALKLYYKLGYDSISLLTLRKEFGSNKRDRKETLLGYEFNI